MHVFFCPRCFFLTPLLTLLETSLQELTKPFLLLKLFVDYTVSVCIINLVLLKMKKYFKVLLVVLLNKSHYVHLFYFILYL